MNLFSLFEDLSSESTSSSEHNLERTYNYSYGYKRSTENGIILRRTGANRHGLYEIEKGLYSTNPRLKLSRLQNAIWRLVLLIMALFFFAAAYVQHNDPDPYLWMPVYIVPLCVNVNLIISIPIGNWSCLNKLITCHLAYCYTLGFWTLAYFIYGQDSNAFLEPGMFAEEAKELLGLCLVIAWLSFMANGNFLRFGCRGIILAIGLTSLPIITWIFLEELEEGIIDSCY